MMLLCLCEVIVMMFVNKMYSIMDVTYTRESNRWKKNS
jgi:hypothetical protein